MGRLVCRGPDDHGLLHVRETLLGHRRLSIIGLGEVGRQPLHDTESDCALVFNGEIYNYAELAREVGIPADSDTRLLLELLKLRDWPRIQRLRGMYAFVFVDPREELLISGRDPFGIKPLYRLNGPDGALSFASVAAALADLQAVKTPDSSALAGFLAWGFFPAGSSPLEGIAKEPPGVLRTWRRTSGGEWGYITRHLLPPPQAEDSLADALRDSVHSHLVSDVPVGVLMSGGLDSTLLAALAAQEVPALRTYTLTNPQHPELDESRYARRNAQLLGSTHVEVPVDPACLADEIRPIVQTSGEPFGDAGYLPLAALCRSVSNDVKVVLAGEGADEIFGGYRRYDFENPLYAGGRLSSAFFSTTGRLGLKSNGIRSMPGVSRVLESWAQGQSPESHMSLLFSGQLAVASSFPEAAASLSDQLREVWGQLGNDPWRFGLPPHRAFDLRQWLPNVLLEKSDRASMLSGVEVRVPYLDAYLVGVGTNRRARTSRKRQVRSLLAEVLPGAALPKRKMGLAVDSGGLLAAPAMRAGVEHQVWSESSLLSQLGITSRREFAARLDDSPWLKFRVAVLNEWQNVWL